MDWAFQAARHEEREQIYRQNLELARQQHAPYESSFRNRSLLAPLPGSNRTSEASQTSWLGALIACIFVFFVLPLVFMAVLFLIGTRKDRPAPPSSRLAGHPRQARNVPVEASSCPLTAT